MLLTLDELIKDAKKLPLVPLAGTTAYHQKIPLLKKYVDDALTSNPSIHDIIGNNPMQIMYDNHGHHAAFMATVFSIGNYELLARTIPWVYRAYSAHHFSYEYFPLELNTWLEAVEEHIPPNKTEEIKSIYTWIINRHDNMVALSQIEADLQLPISEDWLERKNSFLAALLEGNHRKCLSLAKESVATGKDIEPLYLHIIQPVMYEVGMLWERGTISVAQEHLASAIVGRVMGTINMVSREAQETRGKAVITAAPNEFHEIGAWMISDILEHQGWDVRYLGANTPASDLLTLLRSFKPNILALSVTMPFNILKVKEMIGTIKADKELDTTLIIVGGRAFNDTDNLWKSTGADSFASNAQEIKQITDDWMNSGRT